ncbi:MAG TPA: sulfatase-like hydrolase/transferase [Tepidisphaeraceae bacterium]|nr:sulfatase-like hydrolase/transferase [Tepidisphaeraceae bacterium]
MNRRSFMRRATAGAVGATALRAGAVAPRAAASDHRPNVLLIITDQQSWKMMSCVGNSWLKTPALDALAASGVRFDLAYTTNPVCGPSRFSLETGRMPNAANINNEWDVQERPVPATILETGLGPLFRAAGYDAAYGGKIDLPHAYRDQFAGLSYRHFEADRRGRLAEACADYLKGPHERPFFLTASLINPHDICFVAINAYRASLGQPPIFDNGDASGDLMKQVQNIKNRPDFFEKHCPPLPANHAIPALEPEAIAEQILKPMPYYGAFRAWVRKHWTEEDWRIHSWIYHRLTERADRRVGTILAALRDAGLERNTLVVFTSDHGEMNGAHKLEAKEVLYEEATRVPFIMSYKGVIPEGQVDSTHLVSTGLDLLPTLCEYAGIKLPPVALDGRSLRSVVEGRAPKDWRKYVVAESWGDRMIRTQRFKYARYACGGHAEQLMDLSVDPGEMNNLAEQPAYKDALKEHQDLLTSWQLRTWDHAWESDAGARC